MISFRQCIWLLVAVVLVSPGRAPAGEPIVTSDLLRIRSISMIEVSRDGSRAVLAVRSIGRNSEAERGEENGAANGTRYANRSHLFLLDLGREAEPPRQLTFGRRYDHSPVLSPDGRRLAFVRSRSDEDERGSQVWVMPLDGGEARPVTSFPLGAGAPRWSPDGRRLMVVSRIPLDAIPGAPLWPSERPNRRWKDASPTNDLAPDPDGSRASIRAWLEANANQGNPVVLNRISFQDEQTLNDAMTFRHVFLVNPAAPDDAPVQLTRGFYDHDNPVFMPDGRSVLYTARKPVDEHPDRVLTTSIWRISIDGGDDRELLAMDGWSLREPVPFQDGSVIAFTAQQMDEPMYRPRTLGIASVTQQGASDPVMLTDPESFDASVRAFSWMQSRSALVFSTAMRGGFPLLTMGLGLLEPAALVEEQDGMPVGVHAFGIGGGAVVYTATTPANPCVLRVRDARGDRMVWDLNPWVAAKDLATPVGAWLTRPDGTRVQYWLMEPTRRVPGQKYPLVLEIHGGPGAMWGPGEFTMWHEFQLLCSWGYAVVYANPRGSGGYGYAFERANLQDWGDGPAGDVLAAVDEVLLRDWIDPTRLVVTGGSYGGYLTAWIVGHDHRFKAAAAQRGVYDFATFFGEGNAWRLVEWAMGGFPWDPRIRPILQRESPFTYVNRIRTPLLILHASNDLRTGVSQSEMLYRALKQLRKPVEYVRYPNAGHDLSRTGDPMQRMDRLNRIIEFFERFIENSRAAPQVRAKQPPAPSPSDRGESPAP